MADYAFSDKAGSSNFTAGGDKRNEIFSDLLLNRTELETYLTSLRRQQSSATPPANPNTGDMWRCSTTGATYTAGVLYRYSGTAWTQEIATALNVPNRNTVLQGAVNSSGVPTLFEAGTGLAVKLNATATPSIFAFMNGNSASTGAQDIIDGIAADSATFWSSLPINSTVYLFIDRSSTGVLSGSYTTLAPVTQNYAPSHSAGLHWIDFNLGKVQSSDGSVWTQRNRVFVGTATTNGTGVTAVSVTPYSQHYGDIIGNLTGNLTGNVTNVPYGLVTQATVQNAINQLSDIAHNLDLAKLNLSGGEMSANMGMSGHLIYGLGNAVASGQAVHYGQFASGSNYMKTPDGVLICWGGGVMVDSGYMWYTFGAPFNGKPMVAATYMGNMTPVIGIVDDANTSEYSVLLRAYNVANSSWQAGVWLSFVAVGRWK